MSFRITTPPNKLMELAKFKGKKASFSLVCLAMEITKTKVVTRERQGTSRAWIEFYQNIK